MCYSAILRRDVNYLKKQLGIDIDLGWTSDDSLADQRDPVRIFPGTTAEVLISDVGPYKMRPMIYGAFPPSSIPKNATHTSYNARRDNLKSPFWSEAFPKHRGLVAVEAFFEWVAVSDLIKGGTVTLGDVEEAFERQSAERKQKVLEANKKYRPTPTELKDPRERKIIIQFLPDANQALLVPVIFSIDPESPAITGFAIITDQAPNDVSKAGHDRCPIVLKPDDAIRWLSEKALSVIDGLEILARESIPHLTHKIA